MPFLLNETNPTFTKHFPLTVANLKSLNDYLAEIATTHQPSQLSLTDKDLNTKLEWTLKELGICFEKREGSNSSSNYFLTSAGYNFLTADIKTACPQGVSLTEIPEKPEWQDSAVTLYAPTWVSKALEILSPHFEGWRIALPDGDLKTIPNTLDLCWLQQLASSESFITTGAIPFWDYPDNIDPRALISLRQLRSFVVPVVKTYSGEDKSVIAFELPTIENRKRGDIGSLCYDDGLDPMGLGLPEVTKLIF